MAKSGTNAFRILAIGDIVGKIGRRTVAKVLPELREEYRPDLVTANVENIAHGFGITESSLKELLTSGVDYSTGGNHTFDKDEVITLLSQSSVPLIRPANYPEGTPGDGFRLFEVGSRKVLIINLLGRVFMREGMDDPFRTFDRIFAAHGEAANVTIVDFHAEATSEKIAFGWYVEGRASVVVGTHTHVPTADEWVMPGGTGFVTDLGMCGGRDTVIGVKKDAVIPTYLTARNARFEPPEDGHARFNSVMVDIDPVTKKTVNIERIDRDVFIS